MLILWHWSSLYIYRFRGSPETRSFSSSVFSHMQHPSGDSLHQTCSYMLETLWMVWMKGWVRVQQTHSVLVLTLSQSLRFVGRFWLCPGPPEALRSLHLSSWKISCSSPLGLSALPDTHWSSVCPLTALCISVKVLLLYSHTRLIWRLDYRASWTKSMGTYADACVHTCSSTGEDPDSLDNYMCVKGA